MDTDQEQWDIVIKPKGKFFDLNIKEIWKYRDLIRMYIRRDIVTVYKQTVLGPIWYLIQPLLTTIVQIVIFTVIAQVSTDGIPPMLFYMSGGFCWSYFSECLGRSSSTFSANAAVFSKVYFPRLVVPISATISTLFKLTFQLIMLTIIYIYYVYNGEPIRPNMYLLLFPIFIIMLAGLGFGVGILVSSFTTKYRDLAILFGFFTGLWMYATPIVYPLSQAAEKLGEYSWIIEINPLTSIVEATKYALFGEGIFSWGGLIYSAIFITIIVILGMLVFNKIEKKFIDVV